MKFARPDLMYIFLIGFVLAIFYFWAFRARKKIREKFAEDRLLKELLSGVSLGKQKLKAGLLLCVVFLILFALLRPQWGFYWEEVKRRGIDIIIAIDTSKSMLARDIKPSRIERAKLAVKDFTKHLKGDRIGLIAFSGTAFLQCPLTVDYNGFLLALENINPGIIPKGGTSISSAIEEAIRSYGGGEKKYKVLVIITDGEDNAGNPAKLAEEAKKNNIIIFCIGIGTKDGELISLAQENGGAEFLKDRQGNVIKSRLDEALLEKLALACGGSYLRSSPTEFGLELLYREKFSQMEKQEFAGKMNKHYIEKFQIPLALALLLVLAEPLINERK